MDRGGHVLLPVYALGRAQELMLILGKAMSCGRRFVVMVDMGVAAPCRVTLWPTVDLFACFGGSMIDCVCR